MKFSREYFVFQLVALSPCSTYLDGDVLRRIEGRFVYRRVRQHGYDGEVTEHDGEEGNDSRSS
jgi:hypothetical protein